MKQSEWTDLLEAIEQALIDGKVTIGETIQLIKLLIKLLKS